MIEIIPTILVKTFTEIKEKIRQVENLVDWIQIDVADGFFVNNKTWPYGEGIKENLTDLKNLEIKAKIEVHLMVKRPEEIINDWLEIADRVIVHHESDCSLEKVIKIVHDKRKEVGLALNLETPIEKARPFFNDLDLILLMSIKPGWSGQEFEESVIPKMVK
jgi:ribulose-phosphate 3-epimerase